MTAAAHRKRHRRKPHSGRRRILLIASLIGAALLATGLGLYVRFKTPPAEVPLLVTVPEPPAVDKFGDPAVQKRLAECREAVVRSLRSAAAWGKLGMAFYVHEFPDEAKVCFATAEQLDPREARWPYFQGVIRAESDPDGAIQKLERAADLCMDNPDIPRLQLAELLLTHGHLEKATEQFLYLLRKNPNNARAHLGLSRISFMKGELGESQAHLGFSVSDRHTQKASHLLLAQIHERLGNQASAQSEYHQAARAPDDVAWADPYVNEALKLRTGMKTILIRVNTLLEQGRLDECIAQCRKLVHDYPDSDMLWLTLGKALVQQKKDLSAAQEVLQKVLQLAPDSPSAHFQLGFASYLRGDYRAAVTWYRKATELKPDFTFAYHDLGHCLLKLGERAAAIEALRAALRCQPDLTGVHKTLAELLTKDGQYGEAFTHARLALQLDPADATAKKLVQRVLVQVALPASP
jgi:tetratricopeptide (TPR) repeat protein